MSLTDPFKRLKLTRKTATEADVKAAYAALLKVTRPEDDRAAFMELRQAFASARSIAKAQDAEREALSEQPEQAEDTPEGVVDDTVEAAVSEPQPTWTYNETLDWNIANTSLGALIEKTLLWMVDKGPNADAFVAEVAETILTDPQLNTALFRMTLIEFIVVRADPEHLAHSAKAWETFDVTRPDWLTDDLATALRSGLDIFKDRPDSTWAARNYNVALSLFQSFEGGKDVTADRIDVEDIFAAEQTKYRKDDHGSFFDKGKMVWVEKSPVGEAMTDFQAALDQGTWGVTEACKAILDRDEVQSLDEFQDLDGRLRHFICEATGWHSQDRRLVYPDWLTPSLIVMLDDTFGWSRHHGRNQWERQQSHWLHRVISRDREINKDAPSFRQVEPALVAAQAGPTQGVKWSQMFRTVYENPHWLLLGYLTYRLIGVISGMVS